MLRLGFSRSACSALALLLSTSCDRGGERRRDAPKDPVPVETAAVERGTIADSRAFSGTLDAFAELKLAAKIAGRVARVEVELGDAAPEGELLVTLEDAEQRQAVTLAEADAAVANAASIEADGMLESLRRELERVTQLHEQGLMSDAELDTARTAASNADAARERARGGVARARAQLATARIQLGYTRVASGALRGEGTRMVAERHVEPGDAVTAGQPLLTLVEIDPLIAAISVTELDYTRIAIGQRASLATDALPGESFEAEVLRISPRFDETSRQARIELRVRNARHLLKPGMFVRATLVLGRESDATLVPESALTRRAGRDGVFVLDAVSSKVVFRPVEIGIRQGERVQVRGEGVVGRVVTLGQQQLEDGSTVAPQPAGANDTAGERGPGREASGDG
jgi:RND family efflux transporter MFP subunit